MTLDDIITQYWEGRSAYRRATGRTTDFMLTKDRAVERAKRLTRTTGREHVVRNRGSVICPEYVVVPRYELGSEGHRYDAHHASLGQLVWPE